MIFTVRSSPSKWPHNFILSTVDENGRPHARTVSLHTYNDDGFIFCSAYSGPKGKVDINGQLWRYLYILRNGALFLMLFVFNIIKL